MAITLLGVNIFIVGGKKNCTNLHNGNWALPCDYVGPTPSEYNKFVPGNYKLPKKKVRGDSRWTKEKEEEEEEDYSVGGPGRLLLHASESDMPQRFTRKFLPPPPKIPIVFIFRLSAHNRRCCI